MQKDDQHREYIRLVSENRHRIFGYIYSLTGNRANSEDLLQEALITMWEKFDTFDQETNFIAWAFKIAYFKTKNFQRKTYNSKVIFDEEVMEKVAAVLVEGTPRLDQRYDVLQGCLQKLSERDRDFILSRYQPGARVESVADHYGRKIQAAYKALSRIRKRLYDCVNLNMQAVHQQTNGLSSPSQVES